jgi:hypothetical protein
MTTTTTQSGRTLQDERIAATRFFWWWLIGSAATSMLGNIAHALLNARWDQWWLAALAALAALIPPAGAMAATHAVAMLVRIRVGGLVFWIALLGTLGLAGCAFKVSFDALSSLARTVGMSRDDAFLWPISIDLAIAISTLCLLAMSHGRRKAEERAAIHTAHTDRASAPPAHQADNGRARAAASIGNEDARGDQHRTTPTPRTPASPDRAPHITAPHRTTNSAEHPLVNGSAVMRGEQVQAPHATPPALGPRAPRTLTAVPNSAAPHNGNSQPHTHERAHASAHREGADNAGHRASARPDVDQAAIQQWLPVAETIVGDGLTKGRMRRWPEEEHPEVVATILADHAAGTRPSTIGRHHQVHHEMVGKILAAAGELTG